MSDPTGGGRKRKVTKIVKSVADTTRLKKQIARDSREFNKLIDTPAFKKHRVITPGTRLGVLQGRMRKNRRELREARKGD